MKVIFKRFFASLLCLVIVGCVMVNTIEVRAESVDWISADYLVPDEQLYELDELFITKDGVTRPEWFFELDKRDVFPRYSMYLGYTVKSGCKYIYGYDGKFYPTYLTSTYRDGTGASFYRAELASTYTAPVAFDSMEEAFSVAPVLDSGVFLYMLQDATGNCTTEAEIHALQDEVYLIVREDSGYTYYESLTDIFDHNLESIYTPEPEPTPVDYTSYVTVKEVEGTSGSFEFSWDFPDNYKGIYVTIDGEDIYWLDRVSDYYSDDTASSSGSILTDAILDPGVHTWLLKGSTGFISGEFEIVNPDYGLGDIDIDTISPIIKISDIPDVMYVGEILNVTFISDKPVYFKVGDQYSQGKVTEFTAQITANGILKWEASTGYSGDGGLGYTSGEISVNSFRVATAEDIANMTGNPVGVGGNNESGVNSGSSNSKLVQTGYEVYGLAFVGFVGVLLVIFVGVRYVKQRSR